MPAKGTTRQKEASVATINTHRITISKNASWTKNKNP
jgi:hypothetical protein